MDDDLRARYRAPRRDYSLPPASRLPAQPKPTVMRGPVSVPPTRQPEFRASPPPHKPHPTHLPHQPHHQPSHQPHSAPAQHQQHHQPATPIAQPAHQAQPAAAPPRKKRRIFKKALIVVVILIILGSAALLAYPKKKVLQNPLNPGIKSSVSYNLYYPTKLPEGYKVDTTTIVVKNNTLAYAATKGNTRIVFTEQALPAAFDFKAFNQKYITEAQQFHTIYGPAIMGFNQGRLLASTTSSNSWLILSSNSASVTGGELRLIMDNIKQY